MVCYRAARRSDGRVAASNSLGLCCRRCGTSTTATRQRCKLGYLVGVDERGGNRGLELHPVVAFEQRRSRSRRCASSHRCSCGINSLNTSARARRVKQRHVQAGQTPNQEHDSSSRGKNANVPPVSLGVFFSAASPRAPAGKEKPSKAASCGVLALAALSNRTASIFGLQPAQKYYHRVTNDLNLQRELFPWVCVSYHKVLLLGWLLACAVCPVE